MKKNIVVTLTVEVEIDGIPPEEVNVAEAIAADIQCAIPGVLCDTDEYVVFVENIFVEGVEKPWKLQKITRRCNVPS